MTIDPDLSVTSAGISFIPSAIRDVPKTIVVEAKIWNLGKTAVPQTRVVLYEGEPGSGTMLGDQTVGFLGVGEVLVTFAAQVSDVNEHRYFIVVDPDNLVKESDELNNSSSKTLLPEPNYAPDLSVQSSGITINPPALTSLPADVQITVEIRNLGQTAVPQATVALYDGDPAPGNKIGEQVLSFPGQSSVPASFNTVLTGAQGHRFTVLVDPDNLVVETSKTNNTASKALPVLTTYDLEILPADITISPASVDLFQDVRITARVRNRGTGAANDVLVKYILDSAGFPSELAAAFVSIPAGGTATHEITWKANRDGYLPITVAVDPLNVLVEPDETNNSATAEVTVHGSAEPNLAIAGQDIVISPNPANEQGSAVITAIVKNEGSSPVTNVTVAFYDGTPEQGGTLLGSQTIAVLNPGEGSMVSLNWTNIATAGERTIVVVVDPQRAILEVRKDDNRASAALTVLSLPDLAVSSGDVLITPVLAGETEPVTIAATVRNRGEQGASDISVTLYEGTTLLASQIIPALSGNSQATVSFPYNPAGLSGGHEITVIVDPFNRIREQSKDNNRASRSFGVQNASVWLDNEFISPNGDGVKDSASFYFRLDAQQAVKIDVVNKKGERVRTFGGNEISQLAAGVVAWDGLDESGRVAPDGRYQVRLLNAGDVVLESLTVTVDNNRSPFTDAIGTNYLLSNNLTCKLPETANWQWLPDESGVIIQKPYSGELYAISPDGSEVAPIAPPAWSAGNDPTYDYSYGAYSLSPDGELVAVVVKKFNKISKQYELNELWVLSMYGGDGTRLVQYASSLTGISNVRWSPRGDYLVYKTYAAQSTGYAEDLWLIKPDGTGSRRIETNAANMDFGHLVWSADGQRIAYAVERTIRISDAQGNKQDIFSLDGAAEGFGVDELQWLDSQQLALKAFEAWPRERYRFWLLDATGAGNHTTLSDSEYEGAMAIAPNRQSIAVTATANDGISINISDRNGALHAVPRITSTDPSYKASVGSILWSPDGGKLAFIEGLVLHRVDSAPRYLSAPSVVIIDAVTGNEILKQTVAPPAELENEAYAVYLDAWTNDGSTIIGGLYDQYRQINGFVFSINAESGTSTVIASDAIVLPPAGALTSPLERHIAYYKNVDAGACGWLFKEHDLWVMSSLLNLTADLWISRDKSGVVLKGIAADLNFEKYVLEYADTSSPGAWHAIASSNLPVINDVLATWVPPHEGTFLAKLTVWDKAGNSATGRKRVLWNKLSSITNFFLSRDIISPNHDGVSDTVELSYRILEPMHLEFSVYDDAGNLIKSYLKDHVAPADDFISWNGTNEAGQVVPDGRYRIRVFDYEFVVIVDGTPPDAGVKVVGIIKGRSINDSNLEARVVGHALDSHIKSWRVEYGVGDDPQEWLFLKSGPGELKEDDPENALGIDDTIRRLVTTIEPRLDISWLVNKKIRITAVDHAGNTSKAVSNFLEEEIVIFQVDDARVNFDPDFGLTYTVPINAAGKHTLHFESSYRKQFVSMKFQYSKKYEEDTVHDGPVIADPLKGAAGVSWDASDLPAYTAYRIWIKAVDESGKEYLSKPISLEGQLTVHQECEDAYSKVKVINAVGDLVLLDIVIESAEDPKYFVPKTLRSYDATKGDIIPNGVIEILLPSDLIEGRDYIVTAKGTTKSGYEVSGNDAVPRRNCLKVKLDVLHGEAPGCNTLSPERITIKTIKELYDGSYVNIARLTYSVTDRLGEKYFSSTLNADDPNAWKDVIVDTSRMPDGRYDAEVAVTLVDTASPVTAKKNFTVDRVLPTARITYPGETTTPVCAVKFSDAGGVWYGVPIDGIADDNNTVKKYELYYEIGVNPSTWPAPLLRTTEPGSQGSNGSINGRFGTWDVTSLTNEKLTLKLKVIDGVNNLSCFISPASITVDGAVTINSFSADAAIISPANGDGVLDAARISYQIGEFVTLDAKVYALGADGSNVSGSNPVKTLLNNHQHPGGADELIWNGTTDSGVSAPDGRYAVVLSAVDGCGNTAQQAVFVEVDNTRPAAAMTHPQPGIFRSAIAGIEGTADDLHFEEYTLQRGQGYDPSEWITIASGVQPVKGSVLGTWNVSGLEGPWTLRLVAKDAAGNKSEVRTSLDLSPQTLIKNLSATPMLISPNNDGKLDGTQISYELSAPADVKIEMLDASGTVRYAVSVAKPSAGTSTYNYEGQGGAGNVLSDGVYSVRLTATSLSSPAVSQSEAVSLIIDTTPPSIDLSQPLNKSFLSAKDIGVAGSIDDANIAQYSISYQGASGLVVLDQAKQSRTNYTFGTLNALPEGDYALNVTSKDLGEIETVKNIAFTVDRTPPVVKLDTPKGGEFYGAEKGIINVSGGIVEANLETFSLRYGSGDNPTQWTELLTGNTVPADPQLFTWKVGKNDGVPDGTYTLSLYAKDKAGSTAETRAMITVDNTLPEALLTAPKEGDYVKSAIDVSGTAFDRNLDKYTMEISEGRCDGSYKWAPFKTGNASVQDGILANWQALPPDGEYCLRLTAMDKLGSKAEASVNVKVDTQPPAAPVLSGQVENKTNAQLTWARNPEPDIAGYNLYRDNQKLNTLLITDLSFIDQDLTEGVYAYTLKAVDLAGWESAASNEVKIKIDLTGPAARIRSPQDGSTVSDLVDIKGTAYSAEDFKQYRVSIGQGAAPSSWNLDRTSPLPMPFGQLAQWDTLGLAEGQVYSIKLEAEDTSGNVTTHQITVTIDNTPPARPVILTATASGSEATVTWNANTETDLAGYLLYRNDQLANVSGIVVGDLKPYLVTGTTYPDKALPDGTFKYYVVAMDNAGNVSDPSDIREVVIDTRAPHAVIVDPVVDPVDQRATIGGKTLVRAESPDQDVANVQFEYKRAADAAWLALSAPVSAQPYAIYLDPAALGLAYGDYNLRVVATDKGGRADPAPEAIMVTYTDLTAPAPPKGLTALTMGADVTLAWTAGAEPDIAGYHVYRTANGSKTQVTLAPVAGTSYADPGLADGAYIYEVTAVDAFQNESKPSGPATARVYAPALAQPQTPTAQKDIRITGSGATANSAVEIFVQDVAGNGLRGTATADGAGNFTFDIVLAGGENSITAKATDAAGNVSRISDAVMVIYDEAPAAPTGLAASAQGTTITLTWSQNAEPDIAGYHVYRDAGQGWVKVTEAPIQSLTYDDVNLPNGVYTYRITALDFIGSESLPSNEASAAISIEPPQPPVILGVTSIPDGGLDVSWEYPAGTAAGYNLYRSTVSGGPYAKINGPVIPGNSYLDSGLTNGTTCYYVVTAVDQAGNESGYSNEGVGVPSDTVAPARPVITSPTRAGSPITVSTEAIDVAGTTDPGTTVELFRNGASAGTVPAKGGGGGSGTPVGAYVDDASLAPDGTMLAYRENDAVMLRNLVSGETTEIAPSGYAPLWSPDGSRLAYLDTSMYTNRIFLYDAASGISEQLTADPLLYEYSPFSWSADGNKISFMAYSFGPSAYGYALWIKDLASGELSAVVNKSAFSHRLSPDGSKLAYIDGSALVVLDLATGSEVQVDPDTDGWLIDWSPDSRQVAFAAWSGAAYDLFAVAIDTGDRIRLTQSASDVYWPIWMPDGSRILYATWDDATSTESMMLVPADGQGPAETVAAGISWIAFMTVTADGTIAYIDTNWDTGESVLKMASPATAFSFAGILLDPGENIFSAVAHDAAGNASPASEPISVTLDISQMPDLTVTGGDVYLYPPAPVAGQQMAVNVSVRNGGQASVNNVQADIYVWNALGQLELLKSEHISVMDPNSTVLITASWDSTGKTGDNRLVVVVDPYDLIVESAESNNMAIRDFFVAAQEGLSMTTTLDAAEYGSNQNAQINILLRNSGPAKEATLEVLIEDENGHPVTAFDPKNITLAYASESRQGLSWKTGTTFAGPYRVHAVLKDAAGVLAENFVPLIIAPDKTVDASVVTDKTGYGPRENVAVLATLTNNGANFILPELNAKITISDANGVALFSDEKILANVLPGARTTLDASWNTGLNLPGDYTASLGVYLEGQLLTTKSAAFKILPFVNFTGSITAEPSTVPVGNAVQTTAAITNSGNTDAPGFTARIMIVDPETQAVLNTHEETVDLSKTGAWNGRFAFSTEGYGLKTYTVLLQSIYQSAARNLNSASFTVKDLTPPVVVAVSPAADSTYNAAVPITVVATDNASGVDKVEYQLGGGQWKLLPVADLTQGRYSTTWEPSLADNGPHTVNFRAWDKAGNMSTAVSVGFVVQMDAVPPVTSITVGIPKFEQSGSVFVTGSTVFSLDATDNFSGVAGTAYRIDGGPWTAYAPFSIAMEGSHLIEYRSEDNAGNRETAKTLNVIVDNTPPAGGISINGGAAYTNSPAVTLTLSCTDAASGCARMEFSSDNTTWSAPEVYAATKEWLLPSGDGPKTVSVKYRDSVGNVSGAQSAGITLDTTPPVTEAAPAGGLYNTPKSVALATNETATIYYTTDGTMPTTVSPVYSGPVTMAETATIRFFAVDLAGNSEQAKSEAYTIDTQAPILTLSTLSDGSYTNNAALNIAGTVTDNVGVQGLTINGSAVPVNADGTFSQAITLTAGANSITTEATDLAENKTSDVRTIILDQNAPTIVITAPADNSVTNEALVTVTGTVDEESTVTVKVNGGSPAPAIMSGNTFSLPVQLVYDQNTIEVAATDLAGNTGTAKRTVTFDDAKPSLAVTSPSQDMTTNQSTIVFEGTVADLTATTVTVTHDGTVYTPAVTNGSFQQPLTFNDEKMYAVIVTATDAAGNQTMAQRNIIYDKTPPSIAINPVMTPTNQTGQVVGGTMEAGATVAVTSQTAVVGAVTYPTPTTWQAELTAMTEGDNTFSATAMDQAGNLSDPVVATIVLDTIAPATTTAPAGGVYGPGLFVTMTANEAATIYYTTDGTMPTTSSPVYGGPVAITADTMLQYFAKDAAGNKEDIQSVTYTIDNIPPFTALAVGDPKYTTADEKLYVAGNTSFSLIATDNLSGVAKTEYRTDGGAWTSSASFTIPAEGSHVIGYRSIDGLGNAEEERSLAVIVDATPPVTSISASDPLVDGAINTVSPATYFTLISIDGLSGVRTIAYRIDDGIWQAYTGSFFLTGMNAGLHTISYKAADNVLNEEAARTLTVRLIILDVVKKVDASATVLVGMRHEHDCGKEDYYDDDDDDDDDENRYSDDKAGRSGKDAGERGGDDHDRCRKDDRCDELQKRISDILSTAGITHHIAEDEDDFVVSHRSGKYNAYLLVDFKEEDIAEEIREAVYSGSGLIFVKTLPYADPGLDEAFGVKFTGKTTDSDITVTLADSPVSNEGSLVTSGKGVVSSVVDHSAQVFASMEDKHESYPAIVFNQYGKGGVLLYTFDILSAPDQAQAAALLVNSVNHVRPLENLSGNGSVPVRIQVKNASEQADIKVIEYLPAGAKAGTITPPALEEDGAIAWQATLSGGEKAIFGYVLDFPDTARDVEVVTEVAYNNNGNYRLYGRYGLSLSTDTDVNGLLAAVISSLKGITASRADDRARIAGMVGDLSSVKTDAATEEDAEKNIERILSAVEDLRKLSIELPDIRLQLDWLLRFWERQWFLLKSSSKEDERHEPWQGNS